VDNFRKSRFAFRVTHVATLSRIEASEMQSALAKLNIRGNPYALARITAILIGLFVAVVGFATHIAGLGEIGSAFLGAAVAMAFDWVVGQLEKPAPGSIERLEAFKDFISAARNELEIVKYYRERQRLHITADEKYITLDFTALLVPVFPQKTTIARQKIVDPPKGATPDSNEYWIGDIKFNEKQDDQDIGEAQTDRLIIRYEITSGTAEITDEHYWASSVRDYSVTFESKIFTCEIVTKAGKGKPRRLTEKPGGVFQGEGPAFAGQILQWTLSRMKPTASAVMF
jgi:hypothetical protein